MAKRKKVEVEVLDFKNVNEAAKTKEKCEKRLKNASTAKIIAIVGTIASVVGFGLHTTIFGAILVQAGFVAAIVTYCMIGGIGIAFKSAFSIGKAAWFIIPFFPIDIFIGITGFCFAIVALFYLPFFIYDKIIKSINADLEAAKAYLASNGQQSIEE